MIDLETFRQQAREWTRSMVPEFGREARRGLTDEQDLALGRDRKLTPLVFPRDEPQRIVPLLGFWGRRHESLAGIVVICRGKGQETSPRRPSSAR